MAGWNDRSLIESQHHAHRCHGRWGPAHRTHRRERQAAEQEAWWGYRVEFEAAGCSAAAAIDRAHEKFARVHGRDPFRIEDQCGGCVYYFALEGALGSDWGVCTNGASPYDGRLLFEHDGCEQFAAEPPPDVMVDNTAFGRLRGEAMRVTTRRKSLSLDWEAYERELERRVQEALDHKRDGP